MDPVGLEKDGTIKVHDLAELAEQERGCHREGGSEHVADHNFETLLATSLCHLEPLRESTTFIKLDVYDAEPPLECRNVLHALDTLIRCDRDGRLKSVE